MSEKTENTSVEAKPIDDPEEYVQNQRLKDIFRTRKEVRERRLVAKEYTLSDSKKGKREGAKLYRIAVENYLTELRPLFLTDDLGEQYWYQADLGSVTIEPPVYEKKTGRSNSDYYLATMNSEDMKIKRKPRNKIVNLNGLNCLFKLSQPIEVEFSFDTGGIGEYGIGSKSEITNRVVEQHIPFSKLDSILNLTNEYLSERGIELDPEKEKDPAEI
jgi:hypothetical protein